jgi:hypothetical protein
MKTKQVSAHGVLSYCKDTRVIGRRDSYGVVPSVLSATGSSQRKDMFHEKGKNHNLRCGHEITIIVKGFAAAFFCTVHCFFFFCYEYVPLRESGLNSLHHDPEYDTKIGVGHLVSEAVRTITLSCSFRSVFHVCSTVQ